MFAKSHHRRTRFGKAPPTAAGKKSRRRSARHERRGEAQDADGLRLQKVLAAAGIGSRRQCEELIREGRVEVDGKTVSELGTRVDPQRQKIRVDSELVHRPKRKLYYLVNKPAGVLSTSHDPSGRPRVIDLAPSQQRLFTVGRLDKSSGGLILVTNDGELTDLLTHPRYGVEKTYAALVAGTPTPEAVAKLQRGVHLAEGYAHAKRVTVRKAQRHSTMLEIVLDEGRNREVRRLLARIGHKVLSLRRVAMGPLRLGNLQPGESRPLRQEEVEELYEAARQGRKSGWKGDARRSGANAASPDSRRLEKRGKKPSADQPLIDKSLPPEDDADDEMLYQDETGGEPFVEDEDQSGETDDELTGELPSDARLADIEPTPIDLRPLGSKRGQGNQPRTIIGGEPGKSSEPRKRLKQRGGRNAARGKRKRR